MDKAPLTFAQAIAISNDFQFLIGQPLDPKIPGRGKIECIAPAPFDDAKRWLFAEYYREYGDATKALKFYTQPEYDVLLLARPALRKRAILFRDLQGYASENNIAFSLSKYLGLR